MTRANGTGPSMFASTCLLAVVCAVTALSGAGCRRGSPAVPTLDASPLDDAFFRAFDRLREQAADDPAAGREAARVAIEAMGRTLVTRDPAYDRLLDIQGRDPLAGARFLERAATMHGGGGPEEAGLRALGRAWGRSNGNNLLPALALAAGDGPLAPGVRLLLAQRMLGALHAAAQIPEGQRGRAVLERLPGWPVPYSRSPTDAAFPHALTTLGGLLLAGNGGRAVLAEAFEQLRTEAREALGRRDFAMPVTLGSGTPIAAPWGSRAGFVPLVTATIDAQGLRLGLRPVVRWDGGLVDGNAGSTYPGELVATAEALDTAPRPDEVESLARAVATLDRQARPIEARLWPEAAGRGRPAFLLIAAMAPAGRVRNALDRLAAAGIDDFRLGIPGLPGTFVPAFVFGVPGGADAAHRRPRVVVSTEGCAVFPTDPASVRPPADGWPSGVAPIERDGNLSHLAIGWNGTSGFGQRLTLALRLLESDGGPNRLVDLAPEDDASPARVLIDAAFEIAGAANGRFPGLEERFPGTGCAAREPCIGGVPVLFPGERAAGSER